MSKFSSLEKGIYTVFGNKSWTDLEIPTIPSNFIYEKEGEFVRINIIPSDSSVNLASLGGMLIIDIFTEVNLGTRRAVELADLLDEFLFSKNVLYSETENIQFFNSNLVHNSVDPDDPSLFRSTYTIQFQFFRGN
jgi:hypothetical protein